jgi:phosphatidylglycerophosphate synthase
MKTTPAEIFTLPNAVTTAGIVCIADGARQIDTVSGVIKIIVGKLTDLADGAIARCTGQTSDLGAAYDAAADKLGMVMIGTAAWQKGSAPKPALAAIALQEAANGVATLVAQHRYPDTTQRPTKTGKYAMAIKSVGLFGYIAGAALEKSHPRASQTARELGFVATVFGLGLGVHATATYINRAR